MRVLFDTNIILDALLDREPFAEAALKLWQANLDGRLDGFVSAITPVNVFYIARRLHNYQVAIEAVSEILLSFSVSIVDYQILNDAVNIDFRDYEDAVQHTCAIASGLDIIVTRNISDYTHATLSVLTPPDLLRQLSIK